jgi:hypothetical protein
MSIKIRFVTGDGVFSKIIRSAQMGFWASHIESIQSDGTYLSAYASIGVQVMAKDYDKGSGEKTIEQAHMEIPCTPEQETAYWEFMKAQIGKTYDTKAIEAMAEGVFIGVELPPNLDAGCWICSSLHMYAFVKVGIIKICPVEARLVLPRDIFCALCSLGYPIKAS